MIDACCTHYDVINSGFTGPNLTKFLNDVGSGWSSSVFVVCLSVCPSVCPSVCSLVTTVQLKNGRFDRDTIWGGTSSGPKERCVRWGPDPTERDNFRRKSGGAMYKTYRRRVLFPDYFVISCYWRYVALVVVLWRPASSASSSSSASVTALRWEPVNVHV